MVNTFLTHPDFITSARWLDNKRLLKQRVEAMQILNLLEDLMYISKAFSIPQPERDQWHSWIKSIVRTYRSLSYRYLQLKTTRIDPTAQDRAIIDKYGLTTTSYVPVDLAQAEEIRQFKTTSIRIVTLGFAYHPIIKMWLGYEHSLKEYINAHITAWLERGYENNMMFYPVSPGQNRPTWTCDPKMHQNHRAALITKELTRNETPWYQLKPEFVAERGTFLMIIFGCNISELY